MNAILFDEFHHQFQRLIEEIKQSLCRELDAKASELFAFFLAKLHSTVQFNQRLPQPPPHGPPPPDLRPFHPQHLVTSQNGGFFFRPQPPQPPPGQQRAAFLPVPQPSQPHQQVHHLPHLSVPRFGPTMNPVMEQPRRHLVAPNGIAIGKAPVMPTQQQQQVSVISNGPMAVRPMPIRPFVQRVPQVHSMPGQIPRIPVVIKPRQILVPQSIRPQMPTQQLQMQPQIPPQSQPAFPNTSQPNKTPPQPQSTPPQPKVTTPPQSTPLSPTIQPEPEKQPTPPPVSAASPAPLAQPASPGPIDLTTPPKSAIKANTLIEIKNEHEDDDDDEDDCDDQDSDDCHCTECDELLVVSEEDDDIEQIEPPQNGNSPDDRPEKRQKTGAESTDKQAMNTTDTILYSYLKPSTSAGSSSHDQSQYNGTNGNTSTENSQNNFPESAEFLEASSENSPLEQPNHETITPLNDDHSNKRKEPSSDKVRHFKTVSVKCLLDDCPAIFEILPELDEHLINDHGILPHRCVMHGCNLSFSSTYELGRHYRLDHQGDGIKIWQCSKCGMKSKGNHYLLKHMYNYHYEGIFRCAKDDCPHQAKYRQAVVNHYRRNHLPIPERFLTVPRFVCQFESCGKSFRNEEGLIRHQSVMHGSREMMYKNGVAVPVKSDPSKYVERNSYAYTIVGLTCFVDECNVEVGNTEELEQHLESMHNILPYRCHLCNISFDVIHDLDRHLTEIHLGQLEWPCLRCDHKRKSHHALANHMLKFHYEGQFICPFDDCRFLTNLRIEAIRHYNRNHCEYACKFENCQAVFKQKECLKAHELNEHLGERDSFTCNICGKPFSTKGNLKTHQRIHLGVKPFQCRFDGCGKSFRAKEHLTIHERTHSGIKPYRCTWPECGHHTTDRSSMIAHVRGFHFRLPYKLKEQKEKNIIDDRDPRQFVEVIPELLKFESYFHVFN